MFVSISAKFSLAIDFLILHKIVLFKIINSFFCSLITEVIFSFVLIRLFNIKDAKPKDIF